MWLKREAGHRWQSMFWAFVQQLIQYPYNSHSLCLTRHSYSSLIFDVLQLIIETKPLKFGAKYLVGCDVVLAPLDESLIESECFPLLFLFFSYLELCACVVDHLIKALIQIGAEFLFNSCHGLLDS